MNARLAWPFLLDGTSPLDADSQLLESLELPQPPATAGHLALLRVLLTLLFSPAQAAQLLEGTGSNGPLWPSSLYERLAVEVSKSPRLWKICQGALGDRHPQVIQERERRSAFAVINAFTARRDELSTEELVSTLWHLLACAEPLVQAIVPRLEAEIATLALRRLLAP